MAGGKGTRIASIASDIPKPMIKLCGKPILEHQIECLKRNGLTDITLVIGHLGHFIREYFEDGSKFGVKISYYEETEPLGTAGALYKIEGLIDSNEDFLLLCGDTIFDVDFSRLIEFHKAHDADATLVAHPNGHPYDSSLLVTEILPPAKEGDMPQDTHRVTKWLNKEDERLWYKNRVNAGIEMINPRLLLKAKSHLAKEKIDLDRDILKPAVASEFGPSKVFAYDTPEYIKDMGTPDRYYATEADIKSGLVSQRNLSHKQKAIFLDRDGTINRMEGFLTRLEMMELPKPSKRSMTQDILQSSSRISLQSHVEKSISLICRKSTTSLRLFSERKEPTSTRSIIARTTQIKALKASESHTNANANAVNQRPECFFRRQKTSTLICRRAT